MKLKNIILAIIVVVISFSFGIVSTILIFDENKFINKNALDVSNFNRYDVIDYFNLQKYIKKLFVESSQLEIESGQNIFDNKMIESMFVVSNVEGYSQINGLTYEKYANEYERLFGKNFEYTDEYNSVSGVENCRENDLDNCIWKVHELDGIEVGLEIFTLVPDNYEVYDDRIVGYIIMSYGNPNDAIEYVADFELEYETNENTLIMKSFVINTNIEKIH